MTSFSLIPAIDIIDGQLVRLYKGDYSKKTNYDSTPLEMAKYYQSLGLNYIHIVDLNGAKDGHLTNLASISEIAGLSNLQLQVGGGVRSIDHVNTLLDAGVDSVIIGSLFVHDFDLAAKIVLAFPNQIIAGLDVINGNLASHGWTQESNYSIYDFLNSIRDLPLRSIVTTDIAKDGTFEGVNLSLYQAMSNKTSHSIIASGGVSAISDLTELRNLQLPNIHGCIVGKAIIEGKISLDDVQLFL